MYPKLIRLLKIITLVQSKPGITANELAERCEVNTRSIYRDLMDLSSANIPVASNGKGKGYSYQGSFALYPLDLTDEEVQAFSLIENLVRGTASYPTKMVDAYEKVKATIVKEQKSYYNTTKRVNDAFCIGKDNISKQESNFLEDIIQAILENYTIDTTYHTQSRNSTGKRKIDPYCLIPRDHRFYLIGYCHEKNDIRTFRVSRFKNVTILKEKFDNNSFDVYKYLENTWSIERGDKNITFEVKFKSSIARYILEEELFVTPEIEHLDNGDIIFKVTVSGEREFLQWLNQYGPNAEILKPQKHRKQQVAQLKEWIKNYE